MEQTPARQSLRLLHSPKQVEFLNATLYNASLLIHPLQVLDLSIQCRYIHFGMGYYTAKHSVGKHQHTTLQLEYIVDGIFEFQFNGQTVTLHPGESVFIPPQMRHSWSCVKRGAMIGAMLEISGGQENGLLQKLKEQIETSDPVVRTPKATDFILQLISRSTQDVPPFGATQTCAAWLELWFLECTCGLLCRLNWACSGNELLDVVVKSRPGQIAEEMLRYIQANYTHAIHLQQVALQVGISKRHANRIFKDAYGETITSYILQLRLKKARSLLEKHPEFLIKAIAFDVGFLSSSYFTRCFRVAYGDSPRNVQAIALKKCKEKAEK